MNTYFEKRKFFDTYPAAKEIVPNGIVDAETVEKRNIKEILDHTPNHYVATGSLVNISDKEEIYLLNREGGILTTVKSEYNACHNEAHTDNQHRPGETVGEAIAEIGPEKVFAAVLVRSGYRTENHRSIGGLFVIWYEIPEKFSLAAWVDEKMAKEQ